jgi:t-SNARE complex subunit (syntaxin)
MTAFDPIRAQREILTGLADVHKVVLARARDAEQRLAEAEAEHNALAKIERFVADLITEAREKLEDLEVEAKAQGTMGSPP